MELEFHMSLVKCFGSKTICFLESLTSGNFPFPLVVPYIYTWPCIWDLGLSPV